MIKKLIGAIACASMIVIAVPAAAQVSVKGYFRKDGTYVAPHVRSSPNSTTLDNWSTKGNTNPYNGREGTRDPYKAPTYTPPAYTPPAYTPPTYEPYKAPCYYNCK